MKTIQHWFNYMWDEHFIKLCLIVWFSTGAATWGIMELFYG